MSICPEGGGGGRVVERPKDGFLSKRVKNLVAYVICQRRKQQ